MKEPTYYTPTIEEFKVGFRYEDYCEVNQKWIKRRITILHSIEGISEWLTDEPELIRVKHLDREDIEELGWTIDDKIADGQILIFKKISGKKTFYLEFRVDYQHVQISPNFGSNIFDGRLNNYNELKDLMKFLGIE